MTQKNVVMCVVATKPCAQRGTSAHSNGSRTYDTRRKRMESNNDKKKKSTQLNQQHSVYAVIVDAYVVEIERGNVDMEVKNREHAKWCK